MPDAAVITYLRGAELCEESYSQPDVQLDGDVAARVIRAGRTLIIVPRGTTKDPRDWLRDLFACPYKSETLDCWVHPGSYNAASALWRELKRRDVIPTPVATAELDVFLFGHSLGGMIACHLAALFIVHGITPLQLVAYDPARPGFGGLRRLLAPIPEKRVFWTGNDRVPIVPFRLPWWPYQHVVKRVTRIGAPLHPWWRCHALAHIREVIAGDQEQAKLLDPAAIAVDADTFTAAIGL